jgi:hypothetical protein
MLLSHVEILDEVLKFHQRKESQTPRGGN